MEILNPLVSIYIHLTINLSIYLTISMCQNAISILLLCVKMHFSLVYKRSENREDQNRCNSANLRRYNSQRKNSLFFLKFSLNKFYLKINVKKFLSIYPFIYLTLNKAFRASAVIYPSSHLSIYLSTCPYHHLSISIYSFNYLFIYLSNNL